MALPSSMSSGGTVIRRAGLRVAAYPSDPTFWTEVQCSSSTSFPTSRSRIVKAGPSAMNFVVATFEVPYSTQTYYARARHFKTGYTTGAWTALVNDTPGYLVDGMPDAPKTATLISSLHNPQGSILPVAAGALLTAKTSWAAALAGPAIQVYNPSDTTLPNPDGSTVSFPANGWPSIAAPTGGNGAGGTLTNGTYFCRICYVKSGWIVAIGAEAQIATTNGSLLINGPATPAANRYDGWIPIITGVAANGENIGSGAVNCSAPVAFGTSFTYTANPTFEGDAYSNIQAGAICTTRTSAGALLAASTAYTAYFYFDLPAKQLQAGAGPALTASSAAATQMKQDRRICLSDTSVTLPSTPANAGAGGTTTTGGGGRYR